MVVSPRTPTTISRAWWSRAAWQIDSASAPIFWLGVSLLFSILTRSIATSALATLAVWIFFSFFISLGASVVANSQVSETETAGVNALVQRARIVHAITLASPMTLYTHAATIIDPTRKTTRSVVAMGPMERLSLRRFSGPLSLVQSVFIVIPYMVTLIAIAVICFGISYVVFMKQEIRSL